MYPSMIQASLKLGTQSNAQKQIRKKERNLHKCPGSWLSSFARYFL